ncbi:MAG TPA: sigma-70 family RNA polymerase sigma factor [Acidimicrobiales bacterium]|nr:sigma-70 family RNA polymerase sigma factor [Acidimicrobiales bacterium]
MDERGWLADRFEEQRPRLRAVAYRMLGSLADADDAVQDAWLRLSRSDASEIENLAAWLTTVVSRVCLNQLRARGVRREEAYGTGLPDPEVSPDAGDRPADEAVLADSVGLALLVVLDTLTPAERLAFVLHDMFGVPYQEIAGVVGRSPDAARQLASRARRRVRGAQVPDADPDPVRQRAVVDAFFQAARAGDFDRLVSLLDPAAVLRADLGEGRRDRTAVVRGAAEVARRAVIGAQPEAELHPALVNGSAGVVITLRGRPHAVMGFTVAGGRIAEITVISGRDRVQRVAAAVLDPR